MAVNAGAAGALTLPKHPPPKPAWRAQTPTPKMAPRDSDPVACLPMLELTASPLCLVFACRWDIVEDASTDHIVRWSSSGRSFVVLDVESFAKEILPRFFKHSK